MHRQTLSDNWQIRPLKQFNRGNYPQHNAGWIAAEVPAHWQQLPGMEHHHGNAVYRCRFGLDGAAELPDERTWLRLNGVFYYSRCYLNGTDLGRHEGYFIPYERDISAYLRDENELLIEVACPDERDKFNKHMITGIFSHWDCFDPQANPGGIWLPVEIQRSGSVRLHHAGCRTEACNEHFAQLRFQLDLDAHSAGAVTLRFTFTPRTFTGPIQRFTQRRIVQAGHQELDGLIKLREPQLWWTHDLGRPDLYTVTVEALVDDELSDRQEFSFGVRTFELRNWIGYLNGERFLIKGNNYPAGDMRIATMTAERCAEDIRLARACHMNLLRVHAHVDHPHWYEAANEAGMLLWQDLPLQWLYAPSILAEAQRQARAMARLLGTHPSIAIWCMHNEAIHLADTYDESLLTRLRIYNTTFGFSWNRDVMDTLLKQIVENEDPTRPVVRSSGEIDIPYLREGTDAHAYFGWYRNYGTLADAEILRRRFTQNLRFVTEFGTQSFPNLESSRKLVSDPPGEADLQRLEQRHGFQRAIMQNWLTWPEDAGLAEIVDMSQDYQIFVNRYYIDRLRYHKYRPTGGIVPFVLLDPYPAVLWSIIDYWRVPKRSYYAMQTAFNPQYAFCIFAPRTYTVGEAIELPIFTVNDAHTPVHGARLYLRLEDPDNKLLAEAIHYVDMAADSLCEEIDRLRLTPVRPGRHALVIELSGIPETVAQIYEIDVRGYDAGSDSNK
jgi:beta-mannosidase